VTGINCICKPVLLPFIPDLTPSAALECRLALMRQHRGRLLLLSLRSSTRGAVLRLERRRATAVSAATSAFARFVFSRILYLFTQRHM